jgi:hypothetical protein
METNLLLNDDDIAKLTNISGNVDIDKIVPFIYMAQNNNIKRVLGIELFDKMLLDFTNDTLSGEYLIVYGYVRDILVYYTASSYWLFGQYRIDNAGAYTKSVENSTNLEEETIIRIGTMYEQNAAGVEINLMNYLESSSIVEYKQDKGDTTTPNFNWYLD